MIFATTLASSSSLDTTLASRVLEDPALFEALPCVVADGHALRGEDELHAGVREVVDGA